MLLFRSEDWVDKWCKRNNLERGEMLSIQQVWELSKLWYGNRMSVEYHGRSMEQVADVFKQAGLKSKFWYL
jgi:Alkylmercury lyase